MLREALIPYVSKATNSLSPVSPDASTNTAIKQAFVQLDNHIMDTAKTMVKRHGPGSAEAIAALAPATAGSCALLCIYDPASRTLRTAVTGDSRAVLGAWSGESGTYTAHPLSEDQTGFNESEVERIAKAHPGEVDKILNPESGRLLGMAITRGFGDHRWKWSPDFVTLIHDNFLGSSPRPHYTTPPYMTAEPEVTTRTVSTTDFAILASDGLWDRLSSDDAVQCVSRWLIAKRANKPEPVVEVKTTIAKDSDWTVTPKDFAIEDLDNAAVCLVRNALGGNRRGLFRFAMTSVSPTSRNVRDDMTVQVIFFGEV